MEQRCETNQAGNGHVGDILCNVIRDTCRICTRYYCYCLTHRTVTIYNRCTCQMEARDE